MHPKVFFPAPSPNPALIPSTQPNTILPREDPLQTFYRSYSQCHSYTYFEGAESLEKNKKIELELNSIIYIPRIRRDDNNPQGDKDQERERDLDKEREKDQDREWSRGFDGRGRASFANRRGTRGRFPGGPRRFPGRYSRYASEVESQENYEESREEIARDKALSSPRRSDDEHEVYSISSMSGDEQKSP